jgi:hypothetical protein
MDFRDLGENRLVQRPTIEYDELREPGPSLKGELDISAIRYEGGDYAGVTGEGDIRRSVLARVDLSASRWEPLTLTDVELTGADVSNAIWSRTMVRRVEIVSCRATGWRLSLDLAWDLYVSDTRLNYATVEVGRVKGLAVFERCSFGEARLLGDLSRVLFLDCDLTDVEFAACGARDCDFRSSRLAGARGLLSLRGARISGEQVVSVAGQLAEEAGLHVE